MVKLYAYGEAKPPARQQLWHEITGFLEAGKVLSNVTTEELQAIIDEEHITAFGITREERQLKQKLATKMMSKTGISTMCRLRCVRLIR